MSSDDNFLRLIREAHGKGIIQIGVGEAQLNRPGSPVYSWTDHNLPGTILLIAVALLVYFTNWKWGVLGTMGALVLLLWPIRLWGFARLRRRTLAYVLSSPVAWWQLWEIGALSMRLTASPEISCMAPEASWVKFARDHLLARHVPNNAPMDTGHHGFRAVPLTVGVVQVGGAISLVFLFGSNFLTLPIAAILVWLGVMSIRVALTGSQRLVDEMTQSKTGSPESAAEYARLAGFKFRKRTENPDDCVNRHDK